MVTHIALYDQIADLPLTVESYELEGLVRDVSSDFTRQTTVIHLHGAGAEGVGEDVTYDSVDHDIQQKAGPALPLAGEHTIDSFAKLVAGQDALFPEAPQRDVSVLYRRWAFESAALDLALRQAGTTLHEHLGREMRPLTYVVSLRLGEPASLDPVTSRLANYPGLRFKLDPTQSWTEEIVEALRETGAVDSLDFKALYTGTVVDNPFDASLYERCLAAFPDAWIEDPHVATPECDAMLKPHRDRITWDAPIHSVDDIEALPFAPKMVNVKPSRLGPLSELFRAYDYCAEHGIGAYGGGQFELGVGRGHIQYLASLFHPDTPNDVAPAGFNLPHPEPGIPTSPLPPKPAAAGFLWDD
jgi:L-alanine-DL-glutamate epimerase-like enolase superfamily enzyme